MKPLAVSHFFEAQLKHAEPGEMAPELRVHAYVVELQGFMTLLHSHLVGQVLALDDQVKNLTEVCLLHEELVQEVQQIKNQDLIAGSKPADAVLPSEFIKIVEITLQTTAGQQLVQLFGSPDLMQ